MPIPRAHRIRRFVLVAAIATANLATLSLSDAAAATSASDAFLSARVGWTGCTDSERLLGGGYTNDISHDLLVSRPAGSAWEISWSGTGGNDVSPISLCASLAPGITAYTRTVVDPLRLDPAQRTIVATCDSGDLLIGGGFRSGIHDSLLASHPSPTVAGWVVTTLHGGEATAHCMDPGSLFSATFAPDPASITQGSTQATSLCPDDSFVIAGGSATSSHGALLGSYPSAENGWAVRTNGSASASAHALCARPGPAIAWGVVRTSEAGGEVTAACDPHDVVLSGGWSGDHHDLVGSYPTELSPLRQGWAARFASGSVRASAICLRPAPPSIRISNAETIEGDLYDTFVISLGKRSTRNVTVEWTFVAATPAAPTYDAIITPAYASEPDDFLLRSGTATIPAGATEARIDFFGLEDTLDEPDEQMFVRLRDPMNGWIADATAVGTIIDNDDIVHMRASSAVVPSEDAGENMIPILFTLPQASGKLVSFDFQTWTPHTGGENPGVQFPPGAAVADCHDFSPVMGRVTFAPGETEASISIALRNDQIDEHDELFAIALSNPSNVELEDRVLLVPIPDDDAAPGISVSSPRITEGHRGTKDLAFTIGLSAASGKATSLSFVTAAGTAAADTDFVRRTGTISIPAGQTRGVVRVPIIGDRRVEGNETFALRVSRGTSPRISGTATILNDD